MPTVLQFTFDQAAVRRRAHTVLQRLPVLKGKPIRIQSARGLRDRHGPVHAGSFLRERRIAFDCTRAEFPRIFVHEVFHFAWVRLGNPVRRAYEGLIAAECTMAVSGELGWSAEWRKRELVAADVRLRTRRWREYCCESFCDTAAWLYSGVVRHPEFTLPARSRRLRRIWFQGIEQRGFSL